MAVLSTELLLKGYRAGIFPMAINPGGDIVWFSPDPRAIIPLDERFRVSRSLQRTIRQGKFEVTFDKAFVRVIRACAKTHGDTWISREILESYCRLHAGGHAHSIETWHKGKLAGGLYGVHLGGAFFGESMFHHATDASKVALVALVEHLHARNFLLLDTQWMTPHLERFGTFLVSREEYLERLDQAVKRRAVF
ncbi:MAG: leucyl/phenylalanyl-tRNA--protein transferase [Verrucomicrobia subdivision 3 bacterium]|nr:leucyl/phenylalanyl-tRNA--protein transferase [Limisphaerales bacterium]